MTDPFGSTRWRIAPRERTGGLHLWGAAPTPPSCPALGRATATNFQPPGLLSTATSARVWQWWDIEGGHVRARAVAFRGVRV
jgi:hypothetical protein